jgi:hypothetical protein
VDVDQADDLAGAIEAVVLKDAYLLGRRDNDGVIDDRLLLWASLASAGASDTMGGEPFPAKTVVG